MSRLCCVVISFFGVCWVQKQYFSPAGSLKTDFNWLPVGSRLSSIPLFWLCLFVKVLNLLPRGCGRDRRSLKCLKSSAVLNNWVLCLSSQIWKCVMTSFTFCLAKTKTLLRYNLTKQSFGGKKQGSFSENPQWSILHLNFFVWSLTFNKI